MLVITDTADLLDPDLGYDDISDSEFDMEEKEEKVSK